MWLAQPFPDRCCRRRWAEDKLSNACCLLQQMKQGPWQSRCCIAGKGALETCLKLWHRPVIMQMSQFWGRCCTGRQLY